MAPCGLWPLVVNVTVHRAQWENVLNLCTLPCFLLSMTDWVIDVIAAGGVKVPPIIVVPDRHTGPQYRHSDGDGSRGTHDDQHCLHHPAVAARE